MRNAKLIVPALVVLGAALLVGVFTAVSMGGSHDKRVVKTAKVGGRTHPREPKRHDALPPERRATRALHLHHRRLPGRVAPARRRARRDSDRRQVAERRQASGRSAAGRLQGRAAVHVRRGQEARGHEGQRLQGRRHLARDRGCRQEPEHPVRAPAATAATAGATSRASRRGRRRPFHRSPDPSRHGER